MLEFNLRKSTKIESKLQINGLNAKHKSMCFPIPDVLSDVCKIKSEQ